MKHEEKEQIFSTSGRDLTYLVQQQERLVKSNMLRQFIEQQRYRQVAKNVYRKGNEEEIELFTNYGETRYKNNLAPSDTGNLVQFIMNRLSKPNEVIVSNKLVHYCLAIEKCLDFENQLQVKRKTTNAMRTIKENKKHNRKR